MAKEFVTAFHSTVHGSDLFDKLCPPSLEVHSFTKLVMPLTSFFLDALTLQKLLSDKGIKFTGPQVTTVKSENGRSYVIVELFFYDYPRMRYCHLCLHFDTETAQPSRLVFLHQP